MNEKIKKVYVVTSGEYSDYRIEAVFMTKEQANEYINEYTYSNDFKIEEFNVNVPLNKWDKIFSIWMDKEGNTNVLKKLFIKKSTWHKNYGGFQDGKLFFEIRADTEKRAVKIVNEKRIQILAMNAWDKENFCKHILRCNTND